MKILAVGAHPDDIEYGCGGSLKKLHKKGNEIYYLIATKGENWENKNVSVRVKEQMIASERAQVKNTFWLNLPDSNIKVDNNVLNEIEKIIKELKIDILFFNSMYDIHQDHIELAKLMKIASRLCDNVLIYETFTTEKFKPNFYVDISELIGYKENLLNSFKSQIEKYRKRDIDFIKKISMKNYLYGYEIKCKHAEGFYIEKISFDIINKL